MTYKIEPFLYKHNEQPNKRTSHEYYQQMG